METPPHQRRQRSGGAAGSPPPRTGSPVDEAVSRVARWVAAGVAEPRSTPHPRGVARRRRSLPGVDQHPDRGAGRRDRRGRPARERVVRGRHPRRDRARTRPGEPGRGRPGRPADRCLARGGAAPRGAGGAPGRGPGPGAGRDPRDPPSPAAWAGCTRPWPPGSSTGTAPAWSRSSSKWHRPTWPTPSSPPSTAHLGDDAATLRRRTRVLLERISPDLVRERAKKARANTGLRRWVAEPGVDEWHGTFPSEDAATAWAAIDRLAHDLVPPAPAPTSNKPAAKP